jgi:chorismate--pyruvate lyase
MRDEPSGQSMSDWQNVFQESPPDLPEYLRQWLLDEGSLTVKLQAICEGPCKVNLLHQDELAIEKEEAELLGLPVGSSAWVREVILQGRAEDWVYARTIIPPAAMTGRLESLLTCPNKPLGDWLFKEPAIPREELEIGRMSADALGLGIATIDSQALLWARRSRFRLAAGGILIKEVFLPNFVAFLTENQSRDPRLSKRIV